jgi:hypothetical protein
MELSESRRAVLALVREAADGDEDRGLPWITEQTDLSAGEVDDHLSALTERGLVQPGVGGLAVTDRGRRVLAGEDVPEDAPGPADGPGDAGGGPGASTAGATGTSEGGDDEQSEGLLARLLSALR